MNPFLDGILLVNKPQDWTSHDVCAFVRKRYQFKKVGHAGTLDPMATGLLVLLLGQATKKSNELSASDKTYEGVLELGMKTDSHDRTGKILETAPWENVTLDQIKEETAKRFTGDILQIPPMVSALKQKGVRLYDLARKGIEVPRESRKVTVFAWDFQKKEGPCVSFSVKVTKGTYVRTLVNDLGASLGCLATLKDLSRTRSGNFKTEDAVTIDQIRTLSLQEIRQKVLEIQNQYAGLHKS